MNCNELRKSIDELKSSCATLQESYNRMNNELSGKADFRNNYHKTAQLSDKILERYIPNFIEKNPELFDWQLGKKIEGFKDMSNEDIRRVTSAECLSDGNLLVTGFPKGSRRPYLYICQFDEANNIETIDEISIAGIKGYRTASYATLTSTQLTEDTVLIGGGDGLLCECIKDETGDWQLGEKIDGISDNHDIMAIGAVSDKKVLVSTNLGFVYEYLKDEAGRWVKKSLIASYLEGVIKTITRLPDNNILLCGLNALYEYKKNQEGEWTIIDQRASSSDTARDEIDFTYSVELSDDKILLGERFGPLYEFSKDSDDKWSLNEIDDKPICGEYKEIYGSTPEYILKLSDDKLLAVGENNNHERVLHELIKPSLIPLETLKQSLNRIIEKGETQ
ncbi:hypothetical protein IKD67_00215 [Candidatus Saccharibacteria bacterium]|nr:hypothetical protein [Candidatus Saccharibacteria bacterium]